MGGGGRPRCPSSGVSTSQARRRHEARHLSLCRGGGLAVWLPLSPFLPCVRTPGAPPVGACTARASYGHGRVVSPAPSLRCLPTLPLCPRGGGGGEALSAPPTCIPHPWGGGGVWGGGGRPCHLPCVARTSQARRKQGAGTRRGTCPSAGGGGLAVWLPSSPLLPCVRTPGGAEVCGGEGGGRPCCRPFVARMSQARHKHAQALGEALGCSGGGGFSFGPSRPSPWYRLRSRISSRCCPLAVVATSPQGAQCPVPAPSCAHTYWRRYVPGWKRMMRKCGQRGGLTVRLEGFLRRPPPWSRGGPLFRHPTARGGPTAHPLPGACVSTSERPDTGAVVSVRWKWRLQSGRALSSPGPLPPPSAMEAPEVLWQRRGETGGGFICGIPWASS